MKKLLTLFLLPCLYSVGLAQSTQYTAHEWGTFTALYSSDGVQMNDIYLEEEHLPYFVHKMDGTFPYLRTHSSTGRRVRLTEAGEIESTVSLENVNVKMETPVIYFYSNEAFEAKVNVKFNYGIMGQWYPDAAFASQTKESNDAQANNVQADNAQVNNAAAYGSQTNNYTVLTNPSVRFRLGPSIDFATQTSQLTWNIKVNAPNSVSPQLIHKTGETNTWTAPQNTDANIVNSGDEYDKYVFYRGLGHFSMPLKVFFDNEGLLNIKNEGTEQLPYLFVYDKTAKGETKVYWTGSLQPGESKQVHVSVSTANNFGDKIQEFQAALVKAGLYEKEAAAMLNTWKQSYFGTTGLRVFWIVPRSFTDQVIPLSFSPAPQHLERVLVGRSEIMKPEFEKDITQNLYNHIFVDDRFYNAYRNRKNELENNTKALSALDDKIARQQTSNQAYEKELQTEIVKIAINKETPSVSVLAKYPKGHVSVSVNNMSGRSLISYTNEMADNDGGYLKNIDVSGLQPGVYTVCVHTGARVYTEKLVRQ